MKMKLKYGLLWLTVFLPTTVMAIICPPAVVCSTKSIESCHAVESCIPMCDAHRKKFCWNAIKLQFGQLSRFNEYDRPPLNNMCYYLNDCGFYSVILDYQGEKNFKWAI